MNKRIISIIQELCKLEKNINISDLAKQFQVSQRTIRNDLNAINEILKEHGLAELKLEKGGSISRNNKFVDILSFVSEKSFYEYKLSKEERKRVASALLVNSTGYITLSMIADNLFVSRATIISDLDEIKAFIKKGNLKVLSHPNKGLRVEGRESDKRLFLMRLFDSNNDIVEREMIEKYISVQAESKMIIQKIIYEQEHVHKSFLTDDSFQKVLLYLGIMINRNMQGEYVEVRREKNNSKHIMAQDILKYISQYCHINTTEDEVRFLSEILTKVRYMKQSTSDKNAIKIQFITRQFIENVSEEIGINLNGDYDFFENLSNHLESVFASVPIVNLENSIVDEIMKENYEIVKAVRKELPLLTQYIGRKITEAEIGYIAVHVCAAIERKKNKEIAFHVIVACNSGIGTSQLLLEKLKRHFNFHIVDIISSHEAKNLETEKADFIISTVPLKACKLDHVVVSPMLRDEDYIRIGNKIDELRRIRHLPSRMKENKITPKGLMDEIIPVIYDKAPEKAPILIKELKKIVRDYFKKSVEKDAEIFSPYLHHLLPYNHIELDVECKNWREAVYKSAENILRLGYIEERYIDSMIKNIEENGPYIVLSSGFAVPHAGPEYGSIKVGMNLIRLKNPVSFGIEEMDPVEFVCCLSAVDHKTHLKAFLNLVNIFKNKQFKKELHICKTPKEAAEIIRRYEYAIEK